MKFTLDWLQEHLDTDADVDAISDALTNFGLEVEHIDRHDQKYAGFCVARVINSEQHPNADRLKVCTVDIGQGRHESVVCGADNVRPGLVGVFAPPGTTIPGSGIKLKKSRIRGVESSGMLLSSYELGLDDNHDGIIDIKKEGVTIGQSYSSWAGMTSVVFDVAPTPNRPDWLGVRGIARDLAAVRLGKLKPWLIDLPDEANLLEPKVKWEVLDDGNACTRVAGRVVTGLKNCQSPDWMRRRLDAIGQRQISALVDISNYIMFDVARPLHFYDMARLAGDVLTMRSLSSPTNIESLDGVERRLPQGTTVIESGGVVHGIGGLMGGMESACQDSTTSIVIEAAHFHPRVIFKAGRALRLISEAGFRFERSVDAESVAWGVDYAASMIRSVCGGEVSQRCVAGAKPPAPRTIFLDMGRLARYAGKDIPVATTQSILQDLGCQVDVEATDKHQRIRVTPPSWRQDLEYDVCLIEEIFRIEGLDSISEEPLPVLPTQSRVSTRFRREGMLRRYLATQSYMECVNLTFSNNSDDVDVESGVKISNPLSSEQRYLRQSHLPGLAKQAQANSDRGEKAIALFEMGPVFTIEDQKLCQSNIATGIRFGLKALPHWRTDQSFPDAYDVKADVIGALACLGVRLESLKEARLEEAAQGAQSLFHPGVSSTLMLGKKVVARFGSLSPQFSALWQLTRPCVGFEIMIDALFFTEPKPGPRATYLPDRFPIVERDLSFFIPDQLEVGVLLNTMRKQAEKRVRRIDVIDVYHDREGNQKARSVTFRLHIQDIDKTLDESDISDIVSALIAIASGNHETVLRDH